MAGLTLEELKRLGAKPKSRIGELMDQASRIEPTFGERVQEDITKRRETVATGFEAESFGEQTKAESILQTVGQGAGLVFDVAGEALKSVIDKIPEAVKKPVKELGKSILTTPLGEAGIRAISQGVDSYREWKTGNPRAARNLESIVNISLLIPIGAGAKVAERGAATPLIERALVKSGEEALLKSREGFIRELVRPVATKKAKEEFVTRTTERGIGVFKRSIIALTPQEKIIEGFVQQIPNVKSTNTFQRNYNFIKEANFAEAEQLKTKLAKNDFVFTRKELLAKLNNTKSVLAENPLITGDAEKAAEKLITKIQTIVAEKPAKGSELLQIRKDFDRWVESQRGEAIFDPAKESAISIANREIRNTINNFLDSNAKDIGVKESLKKQSALYGAMENIVPKAAQEADTAFVRALQRVGNVLGTKNRIVQGIAAAVGIGGLGAAATFAPAAAITGISGWLVYRGGKLILKPQLRILLGKAIGELERNANLLSRVTGAGAIGQLKETTDLIREFKETLTKFD